VGDPDRYDRVRHHDGRPEHTGIELAVSLASPERRPEAKAAKDIAAGVVLLAAIASVGVGIALFGPRIMALLRP
jgi:hypothetical protein